MLDRKRSLAGGVIMLLSRLLSLLMFTGFLWGCDAINAIQDDIKAVKEDVKALKTDVKNYRNYVLGSLGNEECPAPSEHSAMICNYVLQIKGPYQPSKHKGWFSATVPEQVVRQAKDDCEKVKSTSADYANLGCPDPKMYPYRQYIIYVDGDVKEGEIWHFENNPITNHLIPKERIPKS
jgi:hypothetical protein